MMPYGAAPVQGYNTATAPTLQNLPTLPSMVPAAPGSGGLAYNPYQGGPYAQPVPYGGVQPGQAPPTQPQFGGPPQGQQPPPPRREKEGICSGFCF
mmetsp:Transcript_17426/g.31416  ORF Transcript_17426/g.31416 Transcript_17426/m.31416 type:complete len:96 (-) Transcript_17426:165-452(-)